MASILSLTNQFLKRSAEDWDLGKPLQTCKLLVERRGDALYLDFSKDDGKLFAQSKMDIHGDTEFKLNHWLEQVVDSSRYFALKIQGAAGREATIGFGFRDRDQATDLRESLQHYEKSIAREKDAAKSISYSIPKMSDGEKIHVNVKGGKSSTAKHKKESGGGKGSVPLLLKKPPPPANDDDNDAAAAPPAAAPAKEKAATEKMTINMGNVSLEDAPKQVEEEGSEGAVFTGDEEQWATEFAMK